MLNIDILYGSLLALIDPLLFLFLLKSFIDKNVYTKILNVILIVGLSMLGVYLIILNVELYVKSIIMSLALLIYTFFYPVKLETRLFVVFIFCLLQIFVESILSMFIFKILDSYIRHYIMVAKDILFIGLLSKLIVLGLISIILRIVKPNAILLPKKHNLFLISILLISIFSMTLVFTLAFRLDINTFNDFILFSITLTLVAINIGVFYFYTGLNKYYKNAQKYEMKKTLDRMNERQLSKIEAENHQTAKIWHDMKNHIQALEAMAEEQSNNEYESYIHSLKEQIENVSTRIKTGNRIADIILNKKHSEVSAYDVDFRIKAAVPPELEIEDVDFSSVLFNTIDNAIEATTNLPNGQEGFIHVDLYPRGGNLYYNIRNNYYEGDSSKKLFRKKEYLSPGYGLEIIEDIVSKYDGYLKYVKGNGEFILTIHMPV